MANGAGTGSRRWGALPAGVRGASLQLGPANGALALQDCMSINRGSVSRCFKRNCTEKGAYIYMHLLSQHL